MALAELQSKHEFYKIISFLIVFPSPGFTTAFLPRILRLEEPLQPAGEEPLPRFGMAQVERAGPAAWPIFLMICPGFAWAITGLGVVFLI
jgi:hypothetical protein